MYKKNVFEKIINGEIQADIVYKDNLVTAFYDIHPQASIHIIIIPNIKITTINNTKKSHEKILGRLITVSAKIAKKLKINKSGYRLIINCNKNAGQEIFHLHIHMLGGENLGPIICNKIKKYC